MNKYLLVQTCGEVSSLCAIVSDGEMKSLSGKNVPRKSFQRPIHPGGQRDRYAISNYLPSERRNQAPDSTCGTNLFTRGKVLALGVDALVIVDVVLPAVLGLIRIWEASVRAWPKGEGRRAGIRLRVGRDIRVGLIIAIARFGTYQLKGTVRAHTSDRQDEQ
jgi:hypothetical protein